MAHATCASDAQSSKSFYCDARARKIPAIVRAINDAGITRQASLSEDADLPFMETWSSRGAPVYFADADNLPRLFTGSVLAPRSPSSKSLSRLPCSPRSAAGTIGHSPQWRHVGTLSATRSNLLRSRRSSPTKTIRSTRCGSTDSAARRRLLLMRSRSGQERG